MKNHILKLLKMFGHRVLRANQRERMHCIWMVNCEVQRKNTAQ